MCIGKRQQTEFGEEKLCRVCGEWWPATTEFFYIQHGKYLTSPCKACQAEQRERDNAGKPCAVPGCNQPRHKMPSRTDSRCLFHKNERARAWEQRRLRHAHP